MHDLCDAAEMDDPMAGHVPNVIAGARGGFIVSLRPSKRWPR